MLSTKLMQHVQEWIEHTVTIYRKSKISLFMWDWFEIWFLVKWTEHYSHLYFSSQLCSLESFTLATSISVHLIYHSQAQLHHLPWTFLQFLLCVVAQKMLKAFFVLISLCINAHQERGSQLSTWIYIIHPRIALIQTSAQENRKIEPSVYVILWILVLALLLILWNLNQNIVLRRFCTWRNYISFFIFLSKHNLKCAKMTQKRHLKGTSLLKPQKSWKGTL